MDTNILKDAVKESYGTLAKQRSSSLLSRLFTCCDHTFFAKEVSHKVGYSVEQIQNAPENANMGLGCGNPLAFSRVKKGNTVLDLGSGAGFDCFLAAPLVGETGKVIGVDMTDEMLSLARKNAKRGAYKNVEFFKGYIEDLPVPNNSVDLIISNCVINLSTDKAQVFKEAYRVLKQGGEMSISDIVLLGDLPDFIKNSVEGHIACIAGAERVENYFEYAKTAGFTDMKIEAKTTFPLELVLTDPLAHKIIQDFNLGEKEIKEIASLITSITMNLKKQ